MFDYKNQKKLLKKAINIANNKYTPNLNIPIEGVERKLDILSRSNKYIEGIEAVKLDLEKIIKRKTLDKQIIKNIKNITSKLNSFIKTYPTSSLNWNNIRQKIILIQKTCLDLLDNHGSIKKRNDDLSFQNDEYLTKSSHSDLLRTSHLLLNLLNDNNEQLFDNRMAILYGEGGIGKTHLLINYAKNRIKNNQGTYLFLSESLSNLNPIMALAKQFGFNNEKKFVEALKLTAESSKQQLVIIIDAINEQANVDWNKIQELQSIQKLSIILSIRSGYEKKTKMSTLENIPRITHHGFAEEELEWKAMQKYFRHYKLQDIKEIPILYNEFRNPLFLKIFCESYSNTKREKRPRGTLMTNVFEQYIKKKTKTISKDLGIKIPNDYIWGKIVKEIATELSSSNLNPTISYNRLERIINNDVILKDYKHKLIELLCANGILRKTPHYTKQFIRRGYDYTFTYEKFSNHLMVRAYLERITKNNSDDLNMAVKNSNFLKKALKTHDTGILEAIAIQLPERNKGKELVELLTKKQRKLECIWEATLNSLIWRKQPYNNKPYTNIMHENVLYKYFKEYLKTRNNSDEFLSCLMITSTIPNHPFNALFFHKMMAKYTMAKRDSWWQKHIYYYESEDGSAFDRLCSWAFSPYYKNITPQQKELSILMLSWFLSSTNKEIRDRATYTIIKIIDNDLNLVKYLLEQFNECNDQYILERLYLIAYACAIEEKQQRKTFKLVVDMVYKNIFINKKTPNIVIDQCAKDLIHIYNTKYGDIKDDVRKTITPPYKYEDPFKRLPTFATIEKYIGRNSKNNCQSIINSVMYPNTLADFGRYTIGSSMDGLTSIRISQKIDSNCIKYDNFLSSLSTIQHHKYDTYKDTLFKSKDRNVLTTFAVYGDNNKESPREAKTIPATKISQDVKKSKTDFINSLSIDQKKLLRSIKKYIFDNINPYAKYSDKKYDLQRARRWIMKNVVKLGWHHEMHGYFDEYITNASYYYHNGTGRTERIGKKYQWISLHQLMAIESSNYYLFDNFGEGLPRKYNSTLDFNDRDFDPTIPLKLLFDNNGRFITEEDKTRNNWWIPHVNIKNDANWLLDTTSFPSISSLILNHHNSCDYYSLINYPNWSKNYSEKNTRKLSIYINSYIVKKKDLSKIIEAYNNNYMKLNEIRAQDPQEIYQPLFFKEIIYNTPNCNKYFNNNEKPFFNTILNCNLHQTVNIFNGNYFDLSRIMKNNVAIPSPFLRKILKLQHANDSTFKNYINNYKTLSPSINTQNGSFTLFANSNIVNGLMEEGYTLIWIATGEKMDLGKPFNQKNDKAMMEGLAYINNDGKLICDQRFYNYSDKYNHS